MSAPSGRFARSRRSLLIRGEFLAAEDTRERARLAALVVSLVGAAMLACGESPLPATVGVDGGAAADAGATRTLGPADPPSVAVRAVDWNPGGLDLGAVAAIVEREDSLAVFSSSGAFTLAGGALLTSDRRAFNWKGAGALPAGDGSDGDWIVAIDGDGALWRLRASGVCEPVSDRYGLAGEVVLALGRASSRVAVFQLATAIAVADGMTVTRYDVGALTRLVVAGGKLAGVTASGKVRLVTLADGAALDYALAAVGVGVLATGQLAVTTADGLWLPDAHGALARAWPAPSGTTVGDLAVSGDHAWIALGGEVAVLGADGVVRRSRGQALPSNARLAGSPSGDVWLYAGGAARRLSIDDAAQAKVRHWEDVVRPVFVRACSRCHVPGGEGGLNLSSYEAWLAERDRIYRQVVTLGAMPPAGNALSATDRASLQAWLEDPNR